MKSTSPIYLPKSQYKKDCTLAPHFLKGAMSAVCILFYLTLLFSNIYRNLH